MIHIKTMNNYKFLKGMLIIMGLLNLIFIFSTLTLKEIQKLDFLSSKGIIIAVHFVLALLLLIAGIKQKKQ